MPPRAAEAAVHALEIDAARLVVRAPRAGLVDALPYELGERPPPGAPVVVLLADDAPYARVYVPEPMRGAVMPGARDATVHVDGIARRVRRARALRLGGGRVHAVLRAHASATAAA